MIPRYLLIFQLCIWPVFLGAQTNVTQEQPELYQNFDHLYGPDQELVNGLRYVSEYFGSEGHPFLDDEYFSRGSLDLEGASYKDVWLAYNIYNQELVLRYVGFSGAAEQIILRNQHIRAFRLGERVFEKLDLVAGGERYYQVFREDSLECYIRWYKSLSRSSTPGTKFYNFSKPRRTFLLKKGGQISRFKRNGQFIGIFGENEQSAINKYMRSNHIRMSRISDPEIADLLSFCGKLNEE